MSLPYDAYAATRDLTASGAYRQGPVFSAAPAAAPSGIREEAQAAALAMPYPFAAPRTRPGSVGLIIATTLGLIAATVALLLVATLVADTLGASAFAVGSVMALVPLVAVVLGVIWIDRWEPEPRPALIFAFLWGAGVSVGFALTVGQDFTEGFVAAGAYGLDLQFLQAAVQAPVTEEIGKGLGLLVLFWAARKHFDGPVDGLVYAALIAGGFAFTENILYFGQALNDPYGGSELVTAIFINRGILSPFAHVMFTAGIGIAVGLAARRPGSLRVIGYWLIGLVPALLLHGFWNGILFVVPADGFYLYYALVQVPLFGLSIALVVLLRRQEAKITYDRLAEYTAAGWFQPGEVTALASPRGRRGARQWARQRGADAEMRDYITVSTRLAFTRQRIITGRQSIGVIRDEAEQLARLDETRRRLHARLGGVPVG